MLVTVAVSWTLPLLMLATLPVAKTPLPKLDVGPDDGTPTLSLEGKVHGGKRLLSAKGGKCDRVRGVWKRDG